MSCRQLVKTQTSTERETFVLNILNSAEDIRKKSIIIHDGFRLGSINLSERWIISGFFLMDSRISGLFERVNRRCFFHTTLYFVMCLKSAIAPLKNLLRHRWQRRKRLRSADLELRAWALFVFVCVRVCARPFLLYVKVLSHTNRSRALTYPFNARILEQM